MEIAGIETIMGLVGQPPKEIPLPYDLCKGERQLQRQWNHNYIAIIPYCYACREPLIWHTPAEPDGQLYHCPKCKRRWIQDDKWIESELKGKGQLDG